MNQDSRINLSIVKGSKQVLSTAVTVPTPPSDQLDANGHKMLDAAWKLLCASMAEPSQGRDQVGLFEQIRAEDIAREAGLSSGAFYNRWKTREAFIQSMIDFSLSSERLQEFDAMKARLGPLQGRGASLRELTTAGTAANLAYLESDPTFAIEVHLWSLCRARPELPAKLKEMYEQVLGRWQTELYLPILDAFGIDFRPPFDVDVFSRVLAALAEGLAMQRALDPSVSPEIFGWAVLALIPGALRSPTDERSLDDVWQEAESRGGSHLLSEGGALDPGLLLELRSLVELRTQLAQQLRSAMDQLATVEDRIVGLLASVPRVDSLDESK